MLPLWLLLQVLALGLAAGRIPLYARFPLPIERQATVEMLVMQLTAATLLFPSLLGGPTRWAWVTASSWPMLLLAGLLGTEPIHRIAAAGGYISLWLTMLALLASLLNDQRHRLTAAAVLALWTIGGPILLYLHAEFAGATALWPPNHTNIPYAIAGGPIWAALYHLRARHLLLFSDIPLAGLLVAEIILISRKNSRLSPTPSNK